MKKNVKNLPEFMALIERYETITIQEIEEVDENRTNIAQYLTGFGYHHTCTLCRAVPSKDYGSNCRYCVYRGKTTGCIRHITYDAIRKATDPDELLAAYRERAKYMRTLLK